MSILTRIRTGKQGRPQKVVIYGPEGIGKSTLASQFPQPLFLDVEDSTSQLDVARLGRADLPDLKAFESALGEVVKERPCMTLCVDTIDWLEELAVADIIKATGSEKIQGLEDFGYGKGYRILQERLTVTMARLDQVLAVGINVVLLAHSTVKKFEPPDGAGAFDRYEMKLTRQVAPLVKEWADMLLFGNWRTQIAEKGKGDNTKYKGVGGKERMLYAVRCAAWDAKNRHGMEDAIPWGIEPIRRAFENVGATWTQNTTASAVPVARKSEGEVEPQPKQSAPPTVQQPPGVLAPVPVAKADDDRIPGIPSPADELERICKPHEAAVNAYLLAGKRIAGGQTWRDMAPDFRARVLKNPAGFLKVALNGGSK